MLNIIREKYAKKALLIFLLCSVSLIVVQLVYIDNMQNYSNNYPVATENSSYKQLHIRSESYNYDTSKVDNVKIIEKSNTIEVSDEILSLKENININNEKEISRVKSIQTDTGLDIYTSSVIIKYSNKFSIPVSLFLAIMDVESNFNRYEVGGANDRGYCQIIPGTEKWLVSTYGDLLNITYNPDNIFDPDYNIGLCALYLNHLLKNYKDDYHRVLSEYNRGPYNLKKYYNKYNTFATSYSKTVLSRRDKYIKFDTY